MRYYLKKEKENGLDSILHAMYLFKYTYKLSSKFSMIIDTLKNSPNIIMVYLLINYLQFLLYCAE